MKVKTSVTLSGTLLAEIDKVNSNRSAFLEEAALFLLEKNAKRARDVRDAAILNRYAKRLNREAADVLGYKNFEE